jgi:hypothetical protein
MQCTWVGESPVGYCYHCPYDDRLHETQRLQAQLKADGYSVQLYTDVDGDVFYFMPVDIHWQQRMCFQ